MGQGLIARANSTEPLPEGMKDSICVAVIDLGTHLNTHFNKSERKVVLTFEVPEHRIKLEKDGQELDLPRVTSNTYTLSLGERANLRKDLQSWRGKKFDKKELDGFDLKDILGKPCQLQIVHEDKGDKTYANINNILPPSEKGRQLKAESDLHFFSFFEGGNLPEGLPNWIVEKIAESAEWKAMQRVAAHDQPQVGADADEMPPLSDNDAPAEEDSDPLPF